MGKLVEGIWRDDSYKAPPSDGSFVRKAAQFRNWVTSDGSAGPTGTGGFKAEADRYHLYVSHACPWAHRTIIFRALKGLEDMIGVTVVDPIALAGGWELKDGSGPVTGAKFADDIYTAADTT